VRRIKVILSVLSGLLILATIAGGSGITIIKHTCHMCGHVTYTAESIISRPDVDNNCCSDVLNSNHSNSGDMISNGCCEHKVEQVKIENYVSEKQIVTIALINQPAVLTNNYSAGSPEIHKTPPEFYNKHGGRTLLKSICQILS
jgi:hypothetical protein